MVLLGMVPVFAQTPPITSRFSTRATRLPHFAPWMAARCPAGPEPMTMRSKLCMEPVRVGWGMGGSGARVAQLGLVRSACARATQGRASLEHVHLHVVAP